MMEPPILVFLLYLSIITVSKLFLVCMTVDQGEIHFVNTVWKQIKLHLFHHWTFYGLNMKFQYLGCTVIQKLLTTMAHRK